jgi:hypothetical protein
MPQSMRQPDATTRLKMIITCTGSLVNKAHRTKLAAMQQVTIKKCRIFSPRCRLSIQHAPREIAEKPHPTLYPELYTNDGTHKPICGNM